MPERWGYPSLDEVEKEPPKEAPIRGDIPDDAATWSVGDDLGEDTDAPADSTDDTTSAGVGDDLGDDPVAQTDVPDDTADTTPPDVGDDLGDLTPEDLGQEP